MSAPRTSSRRDLALLAVFPFLLAVFNDYWPFTSTQTAYIDPWLYIAHFLHLKAQVLAFHAGYYGDRLSYIIPGWLVYHAFGPLAGNYVFKLLILYTTLFALYYLLLRLFNRRTALFCSALISVHPFFLIAFGWDYVNGAGIAYCTLCLLLVTCAAQSDKYRLSMFLAGVFWVCLITTHLLWLNLAWIVPLAFWLLNRTGAKHPLGGPAAMLLLGCLTAFGAWCGIYRSLTGRWFYLANSIDTLLHKYGEAAAVNRPVSSWIGVAYWLDHYNWLLPFAFWLVVRRGAPAVKAICSALFVAAFVAVWAWQAAGFPFAHNPDYASFLFPVYAMAVGALVADRVSGLGPVAHRFLVAGTLIAGGVLAFSAPALKRSLNPVAIIFAMHPGVTPIWNNQFFVLPALVLILSVPLCTRFAGNVKSALLFGIAMTFMFAVQLSWTEGTFTPVEEFSNKQGFRAVLEADAWIDQLKDDRLLWVWYDRKEPRQGLLSAVASLYAMGYSLLNANLPELTEKNRREVLANPNVLCMSWRPEALRRARAALQSVSPDLRGWDETAIRAGGAELRLGFAYKAVITRLPEGFKPVPGAMGLSGLTRETPSAMLVPGEVVHITTPKAQWAYAAWSPIPVLEANGQKRFIRISARVMHGVIGFGILNGKETAFYERKFIEAHPGFQDVLLEVTHPGESRKLIIENGTPGGRRADLLIRGIDLMARP